MKKSALLVLSALVAVGCSSSSSPSTTGGDGGGGGGSTQYCPKIASADINALLSAPAASVTETDSSNLYECDASGLQVQLNTADSDKSLYNAANQTPADTHAMQGFGDSAYWSAIGSGSGSAQSLPAVYVHKGSATCGISTDDTPSEFSMPYSQTPAPFSITTADCDAWAQKAGKVCMDFFSAAGI